VDTAQDVRLARFTAARLWWLYLVTGIAWLLFSIIVFRFDWTTVSAISILFGVFCLAAGIEELLTIGSASGGWKIVRILLAIVFIIVGVICFIHPGDTFKALAGVFAFYLLFKGGFDIAVSIARRHEDDLWWLLLIAGIAEILLAFWAAGSFGNRVILLVVWVGAGALIRGITQIIFAFHVRHLKPA
jgi:uncharacterized membrane protein HdeD (DUF308 family)